MQTFPRIIFFLFAAAAPGCSLGSGPACQGTSCSGTDSGTRQDGACLTKCDGSTGGSSKIFVTAETYSGNLVQAGKGATGLESADALCAAAAAKGKLGGSWKAWLSDANTNAIDRLTEAGPWFLVGGGMAFSDKGALESMPAVPINLDENGQAIPTGAQVYAWTATGPGGIFDGFDCATWSSAANATTGNVGNPNGLSDWSQSIGVACAGANHLYCLQQ